MSGHSEYTSSWTVVQYKPPETQRRLIHPTSVADTARVRNLGTSVHRSWPGSKLSFEPKELWLCPHSFRVRGQNLSPFGNDLQVSSSFPGLQVGGALLTTGILETGSCASVQTLHQTKLLESEMQTKDVIQTCIPPGL